jgi:hypothetical protein
MPSARAVPNAIRNCAQVAQSLKLYDCLIKVTRAGAKKTALFWLSCYLKNASGLHKDGILECPLLSYTKFQFDLIAHFNYDPDKDELRWENKASQGVMVKNVADGCTSSFAVLSHNSWVTALLAMQSVKFANQSEASGAGSKSPSMTAATFTIVRKEKCTSLNLTLGQNLG